MQPLRVVAFSAIVSLAGQASATLGVLRASPETPAEPFTEVTITFDRPVAGGLDSSIDPDSVFSIDPAVDGTLEWRDPMTLRFMPAAPLQPEGRYTVTIRAGLRAMDGSELEREYRHTFQVAAPTVIGGDPANPGELANYLPPLPIFRVLVSAPVDRDVLERNTAITLSRQCGATRVPMTLTVQRRIAETDPRWFEWRGYRGPWPRDSAHDLRRVLELTPASPLPLDCSGTLHLPDRISATPDSTIDLAIRTHGPFRLDAVGCGHTRFCPAGPIVAYFSTPVRGADLIRHVRVAPGVEFTVRDTASESAIWDLSASLDPRSYYAVTVTPGLTDIFGQSIEGTLTRATQTTGYSPSVSYEYGRLLVERDGLRTLPVQHVNVDTLLVSTVPVPDSMEAEFLARSWNWDEPWALLASGATQQRIVVPSGQDERLVTGVRLPLSTEGATLHAVRMTSPRLDSVSNRHRPLAVVQVTDLAVHARIGVDQGMVWVTGVSDGLPREDVDITLHDALGRIRATGRTDARGLARLTDYQTLADDPCAEGWCELEGYVAATLGNDRALVGLNSWDPDLAPWRFGVSAAWQMQRVPQSTALFTERGIYRPGEVVIAKTIVRDGPLGSLRAPVGDSIRWVFRDRDGGEARDTIIRLAEFGTDDQRMVLSGEAPLGTYSIELQRVRDGQWRTAASTYYQVAEYRPPEFLVETTADPAPRFAGDTLSVTVGARYLFGAPMASAPVRWTVMERPLSPWEIDLPQHEEWRVGVQAGWWEDQESGGGQRESGIDTLDATGHVDLRVPLRVTPGGVGSTVTLQAMVTDANRQVVTAGTSVRVHPASFYLAAKVQGEQWFLRAGERVDIDVVAVRPNGERVPDVDVNGTIVRREWHRVRRFRNGQVDEVGSWVSDTVATCGVRTGEQPAACSFTPALGGSYTIAFSTQDEQGRAVLTSFPRWAYGPGWVPWNDDSQLKMEVVADRERYAPGDTATIMFASPFTDAEAWITVERERVLESRRIRIADGATTMRLPITEAFAPNVFVSIIVVRGRSAEPGPLDDPGRPTLRVGYAELRVTPEQKRLAVVVMPLGVAGGDESSRSGASGTGGDGTSRSGTPATGDDGSSRSPAPKTEGNGSSRSPTTAQEPRVFQPGDSARFAIRVADHAGRGQRAEVTVWAVDVGVLALTGYRTPDPLDLLYAPRGVGLRLASNLVRVAPQIPDGQKGNREAGGGGGGEDGGILRSRFQTTAFFLGSVVTDENGDAVAVAKLPDNLTTFRVMAIAVTEADRFGSDDVEILVTRPLVARPALPRFLRIGDRFAAGVVVNHRLGGTPEVDVRAQVDNARIDGGSRQQERLAPGRGREFRFDFEGRRATDRPLDPVAPDSAWFRFDAQSGDDADAVRLGIPYRPAWHALSGTVAGMLGDTTSAELVLHDDVDPELSQLQLSVGSSPLGFINGARLNLRFYPYMCTEQTASVALPLIALTHAARQVGRADTVHLARNARDAIRSITRRQTAEGGIGYWSALDWTTPWLSSWAGRVLLEARTAGFEVDSTVLAGIAGYVERHLSGDPLLRVPVAWWHVNETARLSERLAAVDFLSRFGRPNVAAENLLLANAARLRWEDRLVLAEALARRGQMQPATQILDAAWSGVRIEGRVATLPRDAYHDHYFTSRVRPAARLLSATLTINPQHPQLGALVETLVQKGRAAEDIWWNTQDYGWAVLALSQYEREFDAGSETHVRIGAGGRTLLDARLAGPQLRDTTVSLDGLIREENGRRVVRLSLEGDTGRTLFWFATVREAPRDLQTTLVDRGIAIERWYEAVDDGTPIVEAAEGELVRVRLRVTVPAERHFVVIDDPLPAGLEAVDLSLRTLSGLTAFADADPRSLQNTRYDAQWYYGSWDSGFWSPFDHRELRDDRVVYSATLLWPGTYTATYLARATTPGTFIAPPVHAEEMYNPGVNGRTAATRFTVTATPQ